MAKRNSRRAARAASRRTENAVTLLVLGAVVLAAPWFVDRPPWSGVLAAARPFGFVMLLAGGVLLALGRLFAKAPAQMAASPAPESGSAAAPASKPEAGAGSASPPTAWSAAVFDVIE